MLGIDVSRPFWGFVIIKNEKVMFLPGGTALKDVRPEKCVFPIVADAGADTAGHQLRRMFMKEKTGLFDSSADRR